LKPGRWHGALGRAIFVDPVTGDGVLDTGGPLECRYAPQRGRMRVSALLRLAAAHGATRVFLTGPKPPSSSWLDEPAPEGWTPAGHFYELRDPCGRWRPPPSGVGPSRTVEIRRLASWFGEGDYTRAQAREGFRAVRALLMTATHQEVDLMASPAAVGQSLWAWSLTRELRDALEPQLPADVADLIRSTSPQHREEVVGHCFDGCDMHQAPAMTTLADLSYLDGTFMYAACTRELGIAPVRHLQSRVEVLSFLMADRRHYYARARYRAHVTVPADWRAPGLVPVKHPNGQNWHYPNRPGVTFETWADACELMLAMGAGWQVLFDEGLVYTPSRVLDRFTDTVVRLRAAADDGGTPAAGLASKALRSMFVRTIGAFHSRGRDRSYVVPAGTELPAGVTDWRDRPDGSRLYTKPVALTGAAAAFARPELSSQVWARARARVAGKLLDLIPEAIVGVWGDALYLAGPVADDPPGVGAFRVKASLSEPLARPATIGQLLRVRGRMETSNAR
jgi:hypothetical protein